MTTTAAFRAEAEALARAQGMPADAAKFYAAQLGKVPAAAPRGSPPPQRNVRPTARAPGPLAMTFVDRIRGLLSIYGGPPELAAELKASGAPLKTISAWLVAHTNNSGKLNAAGVTGLRIAMLERRIGRGRQA